MYELIQMSYEERLVHFVEDNTWGGKRPDKLLNKYSLEYRKGKTDADILAAKKVAMQKNVDTQSYIMDYAKRLSRILKMQG